MSKNTIENAANTFRFWHERGSGTLAQQALQRFRDEAARFPGGQRRYVKKGGGMTADVYAAVDSWAVSS